MLRRGQRGQSMLEFGIVIPFFLVFIMGIAYFGAAISDYIALNNIARSCAREASLVNEPSATRRSMSSPHSRYASSMASLKACCPPDSCGATSRTRVSGS